MANILYIAPYYWPEEIGSAPYCTELAIYLAEQKHLVQAVCFRPHYPSVEPFFEWADGSRDREVVAGVNIERVPVHGRGNSGFRSRILNDLRFLVHLVRSSLSGRYNSTDVVIVYVPSVLALYGARIVKLLSGAQIIAIVHDIESGLANSLGISKSKFVLKAMRFVERVGLNFASKVIALTSGMTQELKEIGCKSQMEVVSIWGTVAESVEIKANERPTLLYSGNFGKKQNLDQLIPLFLQLHRERMDVDVVLRGSGSEKDRIANEIAALGISNVKFLPLVPAAEFTEALQAANIHLVPQAENVANYALPSKLFSIMAAGRPFICIASAGSPLDELASTSDAGICVPPGEGGRLYSEIVNLLANFDRQNEMGKNGQEFVRRHMDRGKILKYFGDLIGGASIKNRGLKIERFRL